MELRASSFTTFAFKQDLVLLTLSLATDLQTWLMGQLLLSWLLLVHFIISIEYSVILILIYTPFLSGLLGVKKVHLLTQRRAAL